MQAFQLIRAKTEAEAIAAGGTFIGGGTDLIQLMQDQIETPQRVVDVTGVLSDTVSLAADGVRIGAAARMSDVASHPAIARDYPAISEALLLSASPQVRNMATLGGNLLQRTRCGYFRDTGSACNKRAPGSGCSAIGGENRLHAILGVSERCIATHASDLAVALVALDTTLELHGPDGSRSVALADFHVPPDDHPEVETVLQPGELIVALHIPASPLARRSHYLKVRDRASFEWAVVSAAAALDVSDGTIRDARVAIGGVGTKPWRAPAAEAALRGKPATAETFKAAAAEAVRNTKPQKDNAFKVVLAQRTVVRALTAVA